jgi:hypothetical protein
MLLEDTSHHDSCVENGLNRGNKVVRWRSQEPVRSSVHIGTHVSIHSQANSPECEQSLAERVLQWCLSIAAVERSKLAILAAACDTLSYRVGALVAPCSYVRDVFLGSHNRVRPSRHKCNLTIGRASSLLECLAVESSISATSLTRSFQCAVVDRCASQYLSYSRPSRYGFTGKWKHIWAVAWDCSRYGLIPRYMIINANSGPYHSC